MDSTISSNGSGFFRSKRFALLPTSLLGIAGMGISGYLTYIHYRNLNSICLFNANCDIVLNSPYSAIWGIPLSLFGLLLYAAITLLGIGLLAARSQWRDFVILGIYTFSLSGVLFSIYLYYLEIFEIHAFCTWCIASSVVMLIIFILAVKNLPLLGTPLSAMPRLMFRWIKQYIQW